MPHTDPKVLVTDRPRTAALDNVEASTPAGNPDLRVVLISVSQRVAIRAFRTFLQSFLAALGVGIAGPLIPGVSDALPQGATWSTLYAAVLVGAGAALVAALQLTYELSQQWDVTAPERLG